ncbi:hypothetical protein BFI45_18745 [Yersinia pestis subsp. microtus bv. Altaica]|nr:hypothetical protein BFI45_18745 [Yersinia pestis subsp. microtus bv. Altaica]
MGRWWRYKWITFHPSLTVTQNYGQAQAMGGLESTESYSLPLERQTVMAITTHQFVSDSIAAY